MDGDVPEIEALDVDDVWVDADSTQSRHGGETSVWARASLLAAAFLVLGMVLGGALFSDSDDDQQAPEEAAPRGEPDVSTTQPDATTTAAPVATSTVAVTPTATLGFAGIRSAVRLLPGSSGLDGKVVLAEFAGSGRAETVWLIEPGRLAARSDVPLWPGDWPHYLLLAGENVAFTNPPDAYLLDLTLTQPAESIVPARYLVPGSTPDVVWAVNDAINAVTPIDMTTGLAGDELELGDGVNWVNEGVADGFIVNPEDRDTYGIWAYWTPNAPMTPVPLPTSEQSGIHSAAGNTVLIVSPGPRISALDITTGTRIDVFIDIGDGLVSDVCMSPNQQYAVVVGSTGRSVVIDFEHGEVIEQLSAANEFNAVGWTSDTQLVYIADDRLVAIDSVKNERHEIAEIDPQGNWWIGGSAAMC